MSDKLSKEELIREYLLGRLDENEQDSVEERLLSDPTFFDTSLLMEDELLEDYVTATLSESDRIAVETRLLTNPQQQRKVQFIRLLHLKCTALSAKKRSWLWSLLFGLERSHFNRAAILA